MSLLVPTGEILMKWIESGNSPKNSFIEKLANWFSPGVEVRLTELCIIRVAIRLGCRTNYKEIESCTVRNNNSSEKKFSVVEIQLKDKSKFRINSPVEEFIVPNDVNLDQVLQILRDKAVNVIEGQLPS
ncbi:MAG TPA: hypothetical protein VHY30_08450 [Verrucomicrobiae bacterium]|jgi:hypothetical protein|nr:hypothetical protein [Verrucomicrobiae bacterium]